jgi:oligopeptide/dipeptide ABC transporter ATP-binding protein
MTATAPSTGEPLLVVRDLAKTFKAKRGWPVPKTVAVRALDGVSFSVAPGEALGIVGESGCGKSTVARACLRLIEPDAGIVRFAGVDVASAGSAELRSLRRRLQIVFQDPASALDPRQRIADALGEPIRVHGIAKGQEVARSVARLLDEVGLPPSAARRYPHEFSGGQRQRIGIARALALGPDLIFADEPVSALDVSVQAQILVLLEELRQRRRLAFVFISHDLGVVRHFCQRVAVMYLGRIVEEGPVPAIFEEPLHPYTRLLKASSPVPDPERAVAMNLQEGEPPSPVDPPPGCHFHPRCPFAVDRCRTVAPALQEVVAGRRVACHLFDQPGADILASGQEKPESSRISP